MTSSYLSCRFYAVGPGIDDAQSLFANMPLLYLFFYRAAING